MPWDQPTGYQGVRSAHVLKDYFGTLTKCVDYAGALSSVHYKVNHMRTCEM